MKPHARIALGALLASAAAFALSPPSASAAPVWAPAATAAIHPGVMTFTAGSQCTANFVFVSGATVYLGQAAHCSSTDAATSTNGCKAHSLPLGTPVDVAGVATGTLAYNSWLTMQSLGETDPSTCAYNDMALIQLSPADATKVNPSIPFWGGPIGLGAGAPPLSTIYSYGNSSLRLGLSPLSPKRGLDLTNTPDGWSHTVLTVSPGIPGDSGSAFINRSGQAFGILSTVAVLPIPASNNVGDLAHEIAYLNSHNPFGVALANGTEPFKPNRLI